MCPFLAWRLRLGLEGSGMEKGILVVVTVMGVDMDREWSEENKGGWSERESEEEEQITEEREGEKVTGKQEETEVFRETEGVKRDVETVTDEQEKEKKEVWE